jgi:Repeat of unknown function (DUF5648)/GTA TIM-barrel-like domain
MSLSLLYRGFNYVSYYNGAYENADSLAELSGTGANSAALNLEYGIDTRSSLVYADANYTDSLNALGNTITEATGRGLSVMVKPHIDFLDPTKIGSNAVGDWRAYFNPTNPAAFFASYKSMLLAEAQVAQAHGAALLSIGTELDQLAGAQYLSYWTDIISSVRAVFSGKLTYSADWNDDTSPWQGHNGLTAGTGNLTTQISFWSQLDYVGLDVYAPLSDNANPTLADLIAGWTQLPTDTESRAVTGNQSLISYFESVAAQIGKPLIFTEIGYESATDAASQPAGSSTQVFDPALQATLYSAFFEAWKAAGDGSLKGAYFWNWDPNASEVGPGNGANFSPQGLPAENVFKANVTTSLISVERFFDSATGDHFYTLSPAEANQIRATLPTYHDEGSPWSTSNPGPGTIDVFRFFDVATGTHFLTSSVAERNQVIATLPTYHYEGVAFEAYQDTGANTLTLERFFNTQSHLHHYAASAAETASILSGSAGPGWVDEGAGFVVHV